MKKIPSHTPLRFDGWWFQFRIMEILMCDVWLDGVMVDLRQIWGKSPVQTLEITDQELLEKIRGYKIQPYQKHYLEMIKDPSIKKMALCFPRRRGYKYWLKLIREEK